MPPHSRPGYNVLKAETGNAAGRHQGNRRERLRQPPGALGLHHLCHRPDRYTIAKGVRHGDIDKALDAPGQDRRHRSEGS